jgi:hypothetical protein
MRLRRLLAVLVAALALGGFAIAPASAAKPAPFQDGDNSCADIQDGSAGYDSATTTVTALAHTIAATCNRYDYVLRVYTTDGSTELASAKATSTDDGFGGSSLSWSTTFAANPAPSAVCVTLSSETKGGRVVDVAPNAPETGCVIGALVNSGVGAGGWH